MQAFISEREAILDELFPSAELLPGVERLLRHLKSKGVPMCVATSSHRRHFDMKTGRHPDVFALFDHIITGDMVAKGKPDPEIFLTAAAAWTDAPPKPAACLVFEDAPSGVAAAIAAGMPSVMVPDAGLDKAKTGAATLVVPSLLDFDPAHFGLPPFDV